MWAAVAFQFPPGTSPEMPKKFGVYVKNRFKQADEHVSPAIVEEVIRSTLANEPPSDAYSPTDLLTAMFLVTYAIMSRTRLTAEAVDNYIEQVLAFAGPEFDEVMPG